MPTKDPLDVQVMERVRAYLRRYMRTEPVGMNAMEKRLEVKTGYLSRVLSRERGFGPGFILRVLKALPIEAGPLLKDHPGKQWDQDNAWDPAAPMRKSSEEQPNPAPVPQPGQAEGRTKRAKS